jgi:predicted AAA+ superfamily ATPase
MLEELFFIHQQVVKDVPLKLKRYLYPQIRWSGRGICLRGPRGTGKTTLLLQYYHEKYGSVEKCLYVSADNVQVAAVGLFAIASEYFKYGGQALIIDEIHKYPGWAQELKNIRDTYKNRQILVSGSSSLNLVLGKYDLSRRLVFYELKGLSYREFLAFNGDGNFSMQELPYVLKHHAALAEEISGQTIVLKSFREYLRTGYYPFFLEGKEDYLPKVLNIIEKTLFEDLAVVFNLRQPHLPVLKKILWLISSAQPFIPNIEKMSRELGLSKEYVYHYLEFLALAGLIINLPGTGHGYRLTRKPGKIFFENPNLLFALCGNQQTEAGTGGIRETFFVNQVGSRHKLRVPEKGDFLVDDSLVFEVGGRSKDRSQIWEERDGYLVLENLEIGHGRKIPLYLFGFLY